MSYSALWMTVLITMAFGLPGHANDLPQKLDFNSYLELVMKRNQMFESLRLSQEAAELKPDAANMDLSPMLIASLRQMDDRRYQSFGTVGGIDRTQVFDYQFGVAKKWSSGTQTQLTLGVTDQSQTFVGSLAGESRYAIGNLGVQLSQSLWKDGFGRATQLRSERESVALQISRLARQANEAQLLIRAEQQFWDYIYLGEELSQRKDSFERAKRIENWTARRVRDGIAEKSDLIGAQALVAMRELQLMMAQDNFRSLEQELKQTLQLPSASSLPELSAKWEISSHPQAHKLNASHFSNEWIRTDAQIALLESQLKKTVANEVKEQLKPDLVLEAQYKTNSVEDTASQSFSGVTDASRPTTAVGLKVQWAFGSDSKTAQLKSATFEQQSAQVKAARLQVESDHIKKELISSFQEIGRKIEIAKRAASLQNQKAQAEQSRLSKGRAITSQVIQSEQEASEASLTLLKLQAEQFKLLSQLRLFTQGE